MPGPLAQRLAGRMRSVLRRREPTSRAPAVPSALLELARSGPAPLAPHRLAQEGSLSIAVVIPSFRRGSGGHATIVRVLRELRERGHAVSLWLEDCEARHAREPRAVTERSFEEFFAADGLRLHTDLSTWRGADLVLATGWQTVARVLLLPASGVRAYLVQDHEPDFYSASAEALWAAQTYRWGLHCIAASPWLAELLRTRYGASASHFDLAVDHSVHCPPSSRTQAQGEMVAFYARAVTPRRAVPLGLAALAELARRRPECKLVLYGEDRTLSAPFAHSNAGVLDTVRLAELYARATVGVVFSLTNPSLIALEMMACGLPCVELASESMIATFGADGPLTLADPDPIALCTEIERLLGDHARRQAISRAGVALMAGRTWEHAAAQVEEGLRKAAGLSESGSR